MTVTRHGGSGSRSDAARALLRTGSAVVDRGVSVLTGKPLPGEAPFRAPSGVSLWILNLLGLVVCAGVIWFLAAASAVHPALLPVTVPAVLLAEALLVGRLRAQQVVFAHHAIHDAVAATKSANALIASIGTAITVSQNPELYWRDHAAGHHVPKVFTTPDDADAAFLLQLGFEPGRERRFYWRLFLGKLVDPRFHLTFAAARLRGAYEGATLAHRVTVSGWLAVLAAAGAVLPFHMFALVVLLPLGPAYQASALAQFASEHLWMVGPRTRTTAEYTARSHARFALAPPPVADPTGRIASGAWARWAGRQALEVLLRWSVLVGDLPVHDLHHVAGRAGVAPDSWRYGTFARQRSVDGGDPAGLAGHEALGLVEALDRVFAALSAAPNPQR